MFSTINITNDSTINLYIYLIYHDNFQRISILKPKQCIVKNLPIGYLIQANKESLINDISVPNEYYKTKKIKKYNNFIIFD